MSMRFVPNKRFLIIIGAVFLISIGFLVWNFKFRNTISSNEFRGRILNVQNNSIFSEGSFVVSDKTAASGAKKQVEIVVSEQTKIKQIIKTVPVEFFKKTFRFGDLPREEKLVGLETLKLDLASNSLDFKALSDKNIYGEDKIYPSEIDYMVIILNK